MKDQNQPKHVSMGEPEGGVRRQGAHTHLLAHSAGALAQWRGWVGDRTCPLYPLPTLCPDQKAVCDG